MYKIIKRPRGGQGHLWILLQELLLSTFHRTDRIRERKRSGKHTCC
jgi:hypothetical protein